ncbi:hypothetical protein [Halobellus salinisoli]|uniref:hypothetical protein n=1 Tax=Halobellus salinisoli TaxID=3108500 RepID=UPI00300AF225
MSDDLLSYEEDKRNTNPDSNHLRNFNAGWTEALKDDPDKSKYKENPELPNLTWENLGYRLGSLFGETSKDLREELFEWCKEQQAENPRE